MRISDELTDIITELFNTGIGKAAVVLNELLNYEIKISLPKVYAYSLSEIIDYEAAFKKHHEYVIVRQSYTGSLQGKGFLSFPVVDGKTLVCRLLEQPHNTEKLNVIETDAILEVGNTILNAVQSTISDMAEIETYPSLPKVLISHNLFPIEEEMNDRIYILGETGLAVEEISIKGLVLIIYSYEDMSFLETKFNH